jgi:hypothetical protein
MSGCIPVLAHRARFVPRTDRITLAGIALSTDTGISTTIEFSPLGGSCAKRRARILPYLR